MGLGVDTVIHGCAALKKLLRYKRHEHGHAGSGKAPLNFDLVDAQRQAAHKALFLLVVQTDKGTVVFLRHTGGLKHIVAQLLFGIGHVQHKERQHEKALVAGLQFGKKFLCVLPVGGKVAGKYVHIVAAADSLFLLLYLHGVKVGDLALDGLNGLRLVDGLHMEVHQNAAARIEKIRQHFIRKLRGEDLQETHRAVFPAHAKGFCITEAQGGRGNKILGGKAGGGHPLPVKVEQLPVRVEHTMQHRKPFFAVHHMGHSAHRLEIA